MTTCDLCDGTGTVKHCPPGCLGILSVDCAACDGTGQAEPVSVIPGPSSAELIEALEKTYLAMNEVAKDEREEVVA